MPALACLPPAKPDPAFSLVASFVADANEQKVDLCPGFYRDENGLPWILPSVEQAKARIHADKTLNHEHLPLSGHPGLVRKSQELLFGQSRDFQRVASMQTVSGTGANHIAAKFLTTQFRPKSVWISDPSWVNHSEIWRLAGLGVQQRTYPYLSKRGQELDFRGMTDTLRGQTNAGDAVILHACAHNPTGIDLTEQQWHEIAAICREKRLFAVFDVAYQGFASGNVTNDAYPIAHFYDCLDLEFAVAQSFSKNFGLYGERIGVIHLIGLDDQTSDHITPILTQLSRAEITSCPSYGARIIAEILGDEKLHEQWQRDLLQMSSRMKRMRRSLYDALKARNARGSWDHLLTNIGMFSMTGLSASEVKQMREKYHVYLLPSGRLSVTGLTEANIDKVAASFCDVIGTN